MKKNRILFIMQLPPPVHGASMVNNIIYESKNINSSFRCDYINLTTAKDVNDIGKKSIAKYLKSIGIYLKAINKVFRNKYSLIYITLSPHGVAFFKDSILVILLKLIGCKLVFHLHGKGIEEKINKSKFYRIIYKVVFHNVDVIHLSSKLYFDIESIVNRERVWFVPNGINVKNKKEVQNFKNPKKNILYLSNLLESKGSFTLLEAAKILKELGLDFHIDLVGKWDDENFKNKCLDYCSQHLLNDHLTYHGAKYGVEKIKMLKNSSCFILPTTNDCFPISILEAMSYQLPVITTDEGAITDMIVDGYNGFLVKKSDPKDLSKKIGVLIQNEELRNEYGNNSLKFFEKKFTVEIFEKNMIKVLNKIIN